MGRRLPLTLPLPSSHHDVLSTLALSLWMHPAHGASVRSECSACCATSRHCAVVPGYCDEHKIFMIVSGLPGIAHAAIPTNSTSSRGHYRGDIPFLARLAGIGGRWVGHMHGRGRSSARGCSFVLQEPCESFRGIFHIRRELDGMLSTFAG